MLIPWWALSQNNLYLKAQVAYEQSDFDASSNYLNDYLKEFGSNDKAVFLRAKSNLQLKKYQLVLDDISMLKPGFNDEILLIKARANAGLANSESAIQLLDKYLDSNKKEAEPIILNYPEFQELKANEGWQILWKEERYSKNEMLLNNALYAIKSNKIAEAGDRLDELIARYKRSNEGYYYKGKILFEKKNYTEALKMFENALEIEPDNIDYQLEVAKSNVKLKKQKKAIEQFNAIIANDSLYLPAFLGRAEAYLLNKDYENAEVDISKFRGYYPQNPEAQFVNAEINSQSGDFLSAISTFGKLIKANPAKADYFIGRANSYMATKTYKYAIKDYSMALDLDPKNIEVYKLKANAHKLAGETKKACIEWEHAIKLGDIESMNLRRKYCK